MQREPRNPGEDAQAKPNDGTPEEGNTLEDRPYRISIIQQNAVIVNGRKVKGGERKQDKPNSERWL